MIPEIFHLGPLPVNSFGLMIALMLIGSIYRVTISFERSGINPDFAEPITFGAIVSGLIGARLWFIIEYYDKLKGDLLAAIFSGAGFTFYGGFVFALAFVIFFTRRKRIPLGLLLNATAPALAFGYMVGRLGCQLAGDGDYGIATGSIFGMSYATGVVPTEPGVLVFPTPLYESAMAAIVLLILERVEKLDSWDLPFKRFGLCLMLLSIERFLIEFLRTKIRYAFGLSEAHYFAIFFFLVALLMIFSNRARKSSKIA